MTVWWHDIIQAPGSSLVLGNLQSWQKSQSSCWVRSHTAICIQAASGGCIFSHQAISAGCIDAGTISHHPVDGITVGTSQVQVGLVGLVQMKTRTIAYRSETKLQLWKNTALNLAETFTEGILFNSRIFSSANCEHCVIIDIEFQSLMQVAKSTLGAVCYLWWPVRLVCMAAVTI